MGFKSSCVFGETVKFGFDVAHNFDSCYKRPARLSECSASRKMIELNQLTRFLAAFEVLRYRPGTFRSVVVEERLQWPPVRV